MDKLHIKQQAFSLWKDCFGDDDAFIHRYLDYAMANSYFYFSEKNKDLVSFLSLIPISLDTKSGPLNGFYLYGVATSPEYRGQGEGKKLLSDALSVLQYDFVVTIPASESLFTYYRKQGFTNVLKRGIVTLSDQIREDQTYNPEQIFPDEPQVLFAKEAVLNRYNEFKWSYNHYLYLFGEYERDDTSVLFFRTPEKSFNYLVLKEEDNRYLIQDTDLSMPKVMPALYCLDKPLTKQVCLITSSDRSRSLDQPYASVLFAAHIRNIDLSSASLNLALD